MFSIIIPCHNYGKFLTNCIQSIQFENEYLKNVIIVDDNSDDNSLEIIKKISSNHKVKTYSVKYSSLAKTINFAVSKIDTKYFSRIDPDDTYHPMFFNKIVNEHIDSSYDLVYGDIILKKNNNTKYTNQKINKIFKSFLHPLSNGTLVDRKKFIEIGGIDESLKYKDDYDLWLKLNKSNSSINYVNIPSFIYHKHENNMSNNKMFKLITSIYLFFKNLI